MILAEREKKRENDRDLRVLEENVRRLFIHALHVSCNEEGEGKNRTVGSAKENIVWKGLSHRATCSKTRCT